MKEKTLLNIAIICSLVGVLLILFISEKISLKESNITNITNASINQKIKIKGFITELKETPGLYILKIKDDTAQIPVVVFKEEKINITKGMLVEVEGTIVKYKDLIEISADTIKIIS